MNNTDFTGAVINKTLFVRTTMIHAFFPHARLTGARIYGVDAREADFGYAEMQSSVFQQTDFTNAIFQMTNLTGVTWCADGYCPDGSRFTSSCCGHLNGWTTPWCGLADDWERCREEH